MSYTKNYASMNEKRNEYMKMLDEMDEINDFNLQSNKNYLINGTIPTQMMDTRTTTERLRDTEQMKLNISSVFRPIAEPGFSMNIINSIQKHPLNADGSLFRFLAQKGPELVENLKRQYSYGIEGNENDLLTIVDYIANMYGAMKNNLMSVKNYMNSASSNTVSTSIMTSNDIMKIYNELQEYIKLSSMMTRTITNANIKKGLYKLVNLFQDLQRFMPQGNNYLQRMVEDVNEINPNIEPRTFDIRGDAISFVLDNLKKLPSHVQIITIMNKIKNGINSNDSNLTISFLNNLIGLIEPVVNDIYSNKPLLDEYNTIKNHTNNEIENQKRIDMIDEYEHIKKMDTFEKNKSKAQKVFVMNMPDFNNMGLDNKNITEAEIVDDYDKGTYTMQSPDYIPKTPSAPPMQIEDSEILPSNEDSEISEILPSNNMSLSFHPESEQKIEEQKQDIEERNNNIEETDKELLNNQLVNYHNTTNTKKINEMNEENVDKKFTGLQSLIKTNKIYIYNNKDIDNKKIKDIIDYFNTHQYAFAKSEWKQKAKQQYSNYLNYVKEIIKNNMKDAESTKLINYNKTLIMISDALNKLDKKYGKGLRGRKVGSGLNFSKFGEIEFNPMKFENNILSVRRTNKSNIPNLPSKLISNNLKNMINTISGGGIPKIQEISKLDSEEKEYLHKLLKCGKLTDRINVKPPTIDKIDSDINQFEIMKGEILSGNDSKELVKKFKALIIKLVNSKYLPKNQAYEILELLSSLGY